MPNKIYTNQEASLLFGSEGTDDADWSTESVTTNNGQQSAMLDLGDKPRARFYAYRFWTQFQATPTLGNTLRLYVKSGGSETATPDHLDNDDGSGDASVSAEAKLSNLDQIDTLEVDEAAANIEMVVSGIIDFPWRHIGFVLWNESGATITSDVTETKLRLTPIPDEIQ